MGFSVSVPSGHRKGKRAEHGTEHPQSHGLGLVVVHEVTSQGRNETSGEVFGTREQCNESVIVCKGGCQRGQDGCHKQIHEDRHTDQQVRTAK